MYKEKSIQENKFTKFKEIFNSNLSAWIIFSICIFLGVLIRIFLINSTSSDIYVWKDSAEIFLSGDNPYYITWQSFHVENMKHFYAYFPLWMYICSLILLIFPESWFFIVIKILILMFDLLVVILLFQILKTKISNPWRLKIPIAIWFITPLIILTGAMHGKFDSLMFVFLLSANIYHERDLIIPEAIFISLAILSKSIILILLPFYFIKEFKEKKYTKIFEKILLIALTLLCFSIPFLNHPVIYFLGVLGVHVTREHDLAPLFALLSLPFNSPKSDDVIRIVLTIIIILTWIATIVLSYKKSLDIYKSEFLALGVFNSLYWVFLIQYTHWIYTLYVIVSAKSTIKHRNLAISTGIILIVSTLLIGLLGLFVRNGS